jgi:hypothetical protein
MKLSPMTRYYIRKLLKQFSQELRSVVAPGAGLCADSLSDLDAVLNSLYLEATELNTVTQKLENLIYFHQAIQSQNSFHSDYGDKLAELEQQIFWLLGFKRESGCDTHSII